MRSKYSGFNAVSTSVDSLHLSWQLTYVVLLVSSVVVHFKNDNGWMFLVYPFRRIYVIMMDSNNYKCC